MNDVRPDSVEAYLRLSREDLRAPGGMEQKWEDRRAICRRLAVQNDIPLSDENIHCEQESGSTIDERPIFVAILDRVRTGKTKVLITPYQDRLARPDLADLDRIEKAFLRHGATLICSEWSTGLTFDANYRAHSGVLFGVQAVVSRGRLGTDGLKRAQTNISKTKRNHRHSGRASYGYELAYPLIGTDGLVIPPTEAAAASDMAYRDARGVLQWRRYRLNPTEYPILCEICRRGLAGEPWTRIALDLTRRRVPPPGYANGNPGQAWYPATVRSVLVNPFNAGRLAMRSKTTPDGRQAALAPADYILADTDGDWPHPISLSEYYRLAEMTIGERSVPVSRSGLLTGLIFCKQGSPMRLTGGTYRCLCYRRGEQHPGGMVSVGRMDDWARDVIASILLVLPEEEVKPKNRRPTDRALLLTELTAARQLEERATRALDNLLSDPEAFRGVMEDKGYSDVVRRAETQRQEAADRRREIEREMARPTAPEAMPFLRGVLADFDGVWRRLSVEGRHAVVELLIERIDLAPIPDGRRFVRDAKVKLWDWLDDYPAPTLPEFPIPRPGAPISARAV